MTLRVVIFGATSAIAEQVALLYAERGARLHLVGRDAAKLARVAERCAGAVVTTETQDFTRLAENAMVVERAVVALAGIDVALVAHGDLGDQLASERTFESAESVLVVNFTSVVSLLVPLANQLEAQGRGQLAVITSVAGERGRPRNYTYGAAKGALNVYLQGLRSRLYPKGVGVTTLKLGPVDTPMTRDHRKNPLFAAPETVARAIVHALDARAAEVFVPGVWRLIMPLVRMVPEPVFQRLGFLSRR